MDFLGSPGRITVVISTVELSVLDPLLLAVRIFARAEED